MADTSTVNLDDLVLAYLRTYLTPDPAELKALMNQVWAEDGVYQDPRMRVEGRPNLLAAIEQFHERAPGATFKLASGVDEHHGMLRFKWVMFDAQGQPQVEGFDIGELDGTGRLKRITGFFGPFPPPSSSWDSELVHKG